MLPLLLAAAIHYTLHAKDVFQPPKPPAMEAWKSEAATVREPVEFDAREGFKLRGWLYKSDRKDAPFVLFFYGSNEDLSHEANRLAWLRNIFHVNAVSFDDPGYGFSGGDATVDSILSAALQEFDYVRNHLAPATAPIVSYGWSIGTGLAIHVAAQRNVAGLILQAPPASSEEMARWSSRHDVPRYARSFVKVRVDPSLQNIYEGASGVQQIRSPLLIIHGSLDDVVPIAQGREVFEASPATDKKFVEVSGAHHNDLRFTQPPASSAVEKFLQSLTMSAGDSPVTGSQKDECRSALRPITELSNAFTSVAHLIESPSTLAPLCASPRELTRSLARGSGTFRYVLVLVLSPVASRNEVDKFARLIAAHLLPVTAKATDWCRTLGKYRYRRT